MHGLNGLIGCNFNQTSIVLFWSSGIILLLYVLLILILSRLDVESYEFILMKSISEILGIDFLVMN